MGASKWHCTVGLWVCAPIVLLGWRMAALGVTPGQKSDFEDGQLAGWQVGGNAPPGVSPVNVASGGPAGAGDAYMKLTATGGFGALSKLVAFNQSTMAGPYTGVGAISMDLSNLGSTEVQMRIALQGSNFSTHVSHSSFILPPGGQWRNVTFLLDPENFSGADLASSLASIREVRLLHATSESITGDIIAAVVGVDNITAIPVPEPGMGIVALASAIGLLRHRRA